MLQVYNPQTETIPVTASHLKHIQRHLQFPDSPFSIIDMIMQNPQLKQEYQQRFLATGTSNKDMQTCGSAICLGTVPFPNFVVDLSSHQSGVHIKVSFSQRSIEFSRPQPQILSLLHGTVVQCTLHSPTSTVKLVSIATTHTHQYRKLQQLLDNAPNSENLSPHTSRGMQRMVKKYRSTSSQEVYNVLLYFFAVKTIEYWSKTDKNRRASPGSVRDTIHNVVRQSIDYSMLPKPEMNKLKEHILEHVFNDRLTIVVQGSEDSRISFTDVVFLYNSTTQTVLQSKLYPTSSSEDCTLSMSQVFSDETINHIMVRMEDEEEGDEEDSTVARGGPVELDDNFVPPETMDDLRNDTSSVNITDRYINLNFKREYFEQAMNPDNVDYVRASTSKEKMAVFHKYQSGATLTEEDKKSLSVI